MSILKGLDKFGLGHMDTSSLFDEVETPEEKARKQRQEEEAARAQAEAQRVPEEVEFLLAKTVRCPVCELVFKTRAVKSGRIQRLQSDFDLRPRYKYIDTNKYDVVSCPKCGYSAIARDFTHLSMGQIKLIREGVQNKFKAPARVNTNEPVAAYTYEEAIERLQLALYSTMVKHGKASEKAYECLKISWLYRGMIEEMLENDDYDSEKMEEASEQEQSFYEQAYDGFMKAVGTENFPIAGMDEQTLNVMLSNMAFKLGHVEVASKLVSSTLLSKTASHVAKDRAYRLKEEMIESIQHSAKPKAGTAVTGYAFVDGSFNAATSVYGYGGFLVTASGQKHKIQGSGKDPEMAAMRNVAGEVLGSMAAIKKAIEVGVTELTIYYDYMGIEMWATGAWKRNKKGTIAYYDFIKNAEKRISLKFSKVKGHSGIEGNEEADRLAKEAVGNR